MSFIRSWPERAHEVIEEMIRHSLIETLQGFEHEGQRVTGIFMSRPMMDVWRAIFDRRERQQFNPVTGHSERSMFYGTPIEVDRNLDPREPARGGNMDGRIRMVSSGHGSAPIDFQIRNRPEILRYEIQARSRHETRRQSFSYAYVREADPLRRETERREMPVQNMTAGEYQAQEAKRMPRTREMSDLMIAWLT